MPRVWADCLAGRRDPDLSDVTVRSQTVFFGAGNRWDPGSVFSGLGWDLKSLLGRSHQVNVPPCSSVTPALWR
ncbi:MAG: hypothetical protein Ct9H300mP1_39610 [Planctomycetaceae bacterium]|nr:MAG: hypothetical protein Ct9H300mP1_39610 [Planctomycetaceae bacterium]